MTGTKQRGSVLNFIIVAVVLIGLLVAGIYIIRQVTQKESTQRGGITAEEKANDSKETTTPKEEEVAEQKSVELPGTTHDTAHELPQTGPVETIGSIVALGAVVLAGAHYWQSRRMVRSL